LTTQRLVHEGRQLIVNSLLHRQPVQTTKSWWDVVASAGPCKKTCSRILNRLQSPKQGLPVFFLNCDRPLHSGSKVPELVMDAGCRDNRWTASLCVWPPGCCRLVLPSSQEVGSAWVSLSLVGCRCTGEGVFQRNA